MAKTIVIVGTLDTKGEEMGYVKGLIERRGHKTVVIDTSLLGEPAFPPDISNEEVAKAVGADIKEIIALGDEGRAVTVISEGAAKIAQQLHSSGQLDGIVSLGGSMGTTLGLAVMRALPVGVPKLMVSTVAFSPKVTREEVSMDQAMIQCVTDMWGLDPMTERTLESAAAAISAMVETYKGEMILEKPLIGITTLGTAGFKYVWHAKPLLLQRGYEVAVFHSSGMGGRAFERLIEQGLIVGALDLSVHELACGFYGGWEDAGPHRLEAAGRRGIPQVIATGGLGFFCWPCPPESLPPRLQSRKIHAHNPMDTVIQMTKEEMAEIGELIAQKLNKAIGPTVVLIPTQGFSELDKPGRLFYNPEGNRAFIEALKRHIEPKIRVVELDAHINDLEFAHEAIALLDSMMKG